MDNFKLKVCKIINLSMNVLHLCSLFILILKILDPLQGSLNIYHQKNI